MMIATGVFCRIHISQRLCFRASCVREDDGHIRLHIAETLDQSVARVQPSVR